MSNQFTSMDEAEAYIRTKSVEDQGFRSRLLSNPKDVLAHELNLTIPDGFDIKVHEESGSSAHFVIPPSAEIADQDMALVSGGWCYEPYV